ncbi:MAG: TetR/AcrR family transcriptional regulator C-terminal ligand-binding domain-containing protein [Myxococcota bacterium]
MGRPTGSRNPGFEQKRAQLAEAILEHLLRTGISPVSLRELAAACEVTPPTLRHYFGDRDGALEAALRAAHRAGEEHMAYTIGADLGDVRTALVATLRYLVDGWVNYGVGRLNALGIGAGLDHERLGPAYVAELLEPLLQSFEARLARHVASGELAVPSLRVAALQLVSPLVMALLHQHQLGGHACRPLDVDALVEPHVDAFLRIYAVASS